MIFMSFFSNVMVAFGNILEMLPITYTVSKIYLSLDLCVLNYFNINVYLSKCFSNIVSVFSNMYLA